MSTAVQQPQVEIHDVAIDHVNVASPGKSSGAQSLVALTPLLTVLITAVGLLFTFCFNLLQNHTTARQKVDSDWREALAKGIDNEQGAVLIALEMETFAADPVYGNQAKAIAYSSLSKIENEIEFDTAFHGVLENTLEEDQDALILVVRKLSLDLEKLHDGALKAGNVDAAVADRSIASFVTNPESFLADDSPALAEANALTWKLDSASDGLSTLWHGTKTRHPLRPGEADLSGLILLNHDFRRVDFSHASMKDTLFMGKCRVDANLSKAANVLCVAD